MAKAHGKDAKVYVDEFDISGDSFNAEPSWTMEPADVTCYGASSKAYIAGLADGSIAISSFFDNTATTGSEDVITDYYTAGETGMLTVCPDGVDDGDPVWTTDTATCESYNVPCSLAGAVVINHTWQQDQGQERMLVVYQGTIAASANGDGVDFLNAGSANEGAAIVHLTAVTGAGTVDVQLQESSDNGSGDAWANITGAAFTQLSAIGSERITWAATSEQYIRAVITIATFTSVTIMIAATTGGEIL